MQDDKFELKQVNDLTLIYLRKLSNIELTELFVSISSQFASRLVDCKEVEDLKSLQTYLHMITAEIKIRDLPQGAA